MISNLVPLLAVLFLSKTRKNCFKLASAPSLSPQQQLASGPAGQTDLPGSCWQMPLRHHTTRASLWWHRTNTWGAQWAEDRDTGCPPSSSNPMLHYEGRLPTEKQLVRSMWHTHRYVQQFFSSWLIVWPLWTRHRIKRAKVQKSVPPRKGVECSAFSLKESISTFVQDDPNFSFKTCMRLEFFFSPPWLI